MKLALILLMCFVSATWQQNVFWSFPSRRFPFYSNNNFANELQNIPIVEQDSTSPQEYSNYGQLQQRQLEMRSSNNNLYKKQNDARAFGLGYANLNYLASLILSSLSLTATSTSTSTSFLTSTSTITAGTIKTCFTSSLFKATTACRRKRNISPKMLIGDDIDDDHVVASLENGSTTIINLNDLPREGRDIDPAYILASSKKEEESSLHALSPQQSAAQTNRFIRQINGRENFIVTSTSTITTYTVVYTTNVITVTNVAASTGLLCLPSGFTICT